MAEAGAEGVLVEKHGGFGWANYLHCIQVRTAK